MTTDKMPKKAEAAMRLSCNMQQAAKTIQDYLNFVADGQVEFILLAHTDNVLQYLSTIDREQSMKMLEELLNRWKSNKADIPAHYNPDL